MEHLKQHLQPVQINVIVIMDVVTVLIMFSAVVLMSMVVVHLTTVLMIMVAVHLVSFMLVGVRFLPVGDCVKQVLRFLKPSALLHSVADQAGRREIQDASGSQSRELGQADGHIHLANQLVDGACQVTLCAQAAHHAQAQRRKQTGL